MFDIGQNMRISLCWPGCLISRSGDPTQDFKSPLNFLFQRISASVFSDPIGKGNVTLSDHQMGT